MVKYLDELRCLRRTEYISQHFIHQLSDLPLNVGATKYLLGQGTWYFDTGTSAPFVIDLPIELEFDPIFGGTIEIILNGLYVGTGVMFEQTFSGFASLPILRFTGTVILGSTTTPTGQLFNLTWDHTALPPNAPPVILFDFVQLILWANLGTLTGFDTTLVSNYSSRFNVLGLRIIDPLNLVSIGPVNIQDGLFPTTHLSIENANSLSLAVSIQAVQLSFIANDPFGGGEFAINIDNTLTPNASIQNSIFDNRADIANAAFYNPAGLEKDSIYVNSTGVKGVPDSVVSVGADKNTIDTTTNVFDFIDDWFILRTDVLPTIEFFERVTPVALFDYPATYTYENIGLEPTPVSIAFGASIEPANSQRAYEIGLCAFSIIPGLATHDTGLDEVTLVAHGLTTGDFVNVGIVAAPTVAELDASTVYEVSVLTVDTFQLLRNSIVVDLVNATSTQEYCLAVFTGSRVAIRPSANNAQFLSVSATVETALSTFYAPVIRATDSVTTAVVLSYGFQMRRA